MQQKNKISALSILAFSLLMISSLQDVDAQCKVFVKTCLPQLRPYIHDGSYQAVVMGEGEEAEVYKTIFAGQQYRLYICIDNTLSQVEYIVSDIRRNILFDSRKNNNVNVWNFKSESSQQIKITIRLPKSNQSGLGQVYGCVGVIFGVLE